MVKRGPPPTWAPHPKCGAAPDPSAPRQGFGAFPIRNPNSPPLVKEWGFLIVLREREPIADRFTVYAHIGRCADVPAHLALMQAGNPRALVCVAAYESDVSPAFEERFIHPLASLAVGGGWYLWTPKLRNACELPPVFAKRLLQADIPQSDLDALAGLDLAARSAGPVWRSR